MGFYLFKKYETLNFKQSFNLSIQPKIYFDKISILPSGNFIALSNENNSIYYLNNNFNLIKKYNIGYTVEYQYEISIKNKSDSFCIYNEEIIEIYSLINSNIKLLNTIPIFKNIKKVEFFQTNELIVNNNFKYYILQEMSQTYQIKLVLNFPHPIFNISEFLNLFCIANFNSIILFNYKHKKFKIHKNILLNGFSEYEQTYKIFNINKNRIIIIFKPGSIGHYGHAGFYEFKFISIPDGKIINELKMEYHPSDCYFFKNKEIFLIAYFYGINLYNINNLYLIKTIKIKDFYFLPNKYNIFILNENEIGIYLKDKNIIHIFNFSNKEEENLLS